MLNIAKTNTGRTTAGLILLLAFAALACGQAAPASTEPVVPTFEPVEDVVVTDGRFTVHLPPWFDQPPPDAQTIRMVGAGDSQVIAVARHPGPPRLVGDFMLRILPESGPFHNLASVEAGPQQVTLTADIGGDVPQKAIFHLVYCDGHTYQLTAAAAAVYYDSMQREWERVVASARCDGAPQRPPNGRDLLGVSANPPGGEVDWPSLQETLALAYAGGARASHVALAWDEIEKEAGVYEWTNPDILIDGHTLEGFRMTAVLPFIFTSVPGGTPPDLAGRPLNDPVYIDRAIAFTRALLDRYDGQIDALFIGNEVNIYFTARPEQLAPFRELFDALRAAVASSHPHIPTGTTLAFHTAQEQRRMDLITTFGDADIYGFTYYPFVNNFEFTANPAIFAATLAEMARVAGESRFMIVENGWATAPLLSGDESAQAAYMRETLAALAANPGFERHIWYTLHDGRPDQCAIIAQSFYPADIDPATLGIAGDRFEAYLCTLGLRRMDGSPKAAWEVFVAGAGRWR